MGTNWSIVRRGALLRTKGGLRTLFFMKLFFKRGGSGIVIAFDPVDDEFREYRVEGIELAPVEAIEQMSPRELTLHRELFPEIYSQDSPKGAGSASAFSQQVDGKHYSSMPDGYQPFQISRALGLNPVEHTILKYLLRHRRKNGKVDLEKIKHCVDILIEQEYPNE